MKFLNKNPEHFAMLTRTAEIKKNLIMKDLMIAIAEKCY